MMLKKGVTKVLERFPSAILAMKEELMKLLTVKLSPGTITLLAKTRSNDDSSNYYDRSKLGYQVIKPFQCK